VLVAGCTKDDLSVSHRNVRKKKNTYPPGICHAWEKFYLGVTELVEGPGDVRSRLKAAYLNHLWGLHSDEVPSDLRADYEWIVHMLTKRKRQSRAGQTELDASLEQMRNKTAAEIAKRIFRMYLLLQEKLDDERC
jgi:hypothetical protein